MADYDPKQLAKNIESFVKGDGSDISRDETVLLSPPATDDRPSAAAELAAGALPEMRRVQEVSRPVPGTRMQLLKKVMLAILAPLARRQQTYNEVNTQAVEALADHVDRLTRELGGLRQENRRTEEQVSQALDEVHGELTRADEQLRDDVQKRLNADNHQTRAAIENLQQQISDNLASVWKAIENINGRMDGYQAGAQSWQEQMRNQQQQISDNAEGVWKAIENINGRMEQMRAETRDGDLGIWKGFETLKEEVETARQMAWKIQEGLRELRARVITNTESQSKLIDHMEKLDQRVSTHQPVPGQQRSLSSADTIVESKGLSPLVQHQLDLAYLRFQRQFRGDEEDLRRRQSKYVQLIRRQFDDLEFDETPRVLDVACGDGIFLEMLIEGGFEAKGVDINPAMAKYGRDKKLPIEIGDGITYLAEGPEGHWHAITAFQFVEHLDPPTLLMFLRGARRSLAPGGVLILETLNPNTLMAHKWFHMDLSHERLIFPQMLQLLCEVVGLRHVDTRGISEVPEHERLARAGDPASQANFERLNQLLYGAQDYYLVARKP